MPYDQGLSSEASDTPVTCHVSFGYQVLCMLATESTMPSAELMSLQKHVTLMSAELMSSVSHVSVQRV